MNLLQTLGKSVLPVHEIAPTGTQLPIGAVVLGLYLFLLSEGCVWGGLRVAASVPRWGENLPTGLCLLPVPQDQAQAGTNWQVAGSRQQAAYYYDDQRERASVGFRCQHERAEGVGTSGKYP